MPNPKQCPVNILIQAEKAEFEGAVGICPVQEADSREKSRFGDINPENRLLELLGKAFSLWSQKHPSANPIPDSVGKSPTEITATPAYYEVIGALERLGTATPRQISQATGLSVPTVQRHLRALLNEGTVTKQGSTRSVRYQLSKPD